jgi:hypothetical protein
MKKLILIAFLLFLTSCTYYQVRFVDWQGGAELKGRYNEYTPAIEVTLPSGEKLIGDDVPYEKISFGKWSLFYQSAPKNAIVGFKPGTAMGVNKYARLIGNKGTVMEIIFKYNAYAGQGYGWAKTSDGRDYDVFFSDVKISAEKKKSPEKKGSTDKKEKK